MGSRKGRLLDGNTAKFTYIGNDLDGFTSQVKGSTPFIILFNEGGLQVNEIALLLWDSSANPYTDYEVDVAGDVEGAWGRIEMKAGESGDKGRERAWQIGRIPSQIVQRVRITAPHLPTRESLCIVAMEARLV